jgi:signal transduction histidine kinase
MVSDQPRAFGPAAWFSWLRLQLPHRAERSRPAAGRRIDWLLFAGSAILGAATLASLWHDHSPVLGAVDIVAGSLACLALWVRRSRPVAVLVVFVAASFSPLALIAGLVAVFNAALRVRGRRALACIAALTAASSVIFPLVNPKAAEVFRPALPAFLFGLIAFGAGLFAQARQELVASLRQRADQMAADQARRVGEAREAERRRIAREMHDVLAHRLSLLSIHAGALQFRADASAAEIAQAATVIRTSAAAALDELSQVITVLREDTPGTISAPQPTLADLADLLDESRAAGMRLQAHVRLDDGRALPAAMGRAAYRVVQEGLTNARKHAAGAPVSVSIDINCHGCLLIEVVSHGGAATPASPPPPAPGSGSGLIGLAERLALIGGTLEQHAGTNGDFTLRASLPLSPPLSPPPRPGLSP